MAFKVVVSEKEKSVQMEVEASKTKKLVGLALGEEFDGDIVGLEGYTLKITGGSDKNGFPMKKDLSGPRRVRSLVSGGIGYHPTRNGERRRKTFRGNTISEDIVQISTIVTKAGAKSLDEIAGSEEE
ncbi:MAG: 30S ribosomal protein S6e [Methanobacteriaceae archaeon]|nr:30S ribosomal protein S6e [Methanobacteriaceae archaeon]